MTAAPSFDHRDALEAFQLERLRALLKEMAANPFYKARLAAVGEVSRLSDFTARVPFTTKADLVADQRAHPPYGSNLTYPLERYTRLHQTSASTGAPLRWLDTNDGWSWMLGNWQRVYEAALVGAHDRIFFAFSFGPFLGFWTAFEAGTRLGCLCIPGGGMSSAARLRTILDNAVSVLCCTPTYALRLAEVAREEGIALSGAKVRRIVVAGEPGGSIPATRAMIESAWPGARVFDHHGMTEIGPVSYENPARPGILHIIESSYLAEIVDPATGQPAAIGQPGELVLTTLGRFGSPLLRYRTGDLVKRSPLNAQDLGTCDLALEGGILGRADDMVLVRGVNVYPSAIEAIVRACGEVAEYRVEIACERQMAELRMQFEPVPGADADELAQRLQERLREALGLRIPVTAAQPGSLPRFELKARRWVRV